MAEYQVKISLECSEAMGTFSTIEKSTAARAAGSRGPIEIVGPCICVKAGLRTKVLYDGAHAPDFYCKEQFLGIPSWHIERETQAVALAHVSKTAHVKDWICPAEQHRNRHPSPHSCKSLVLYTCPAVPTIHCRQ